MVIGHWILLMLFGRVQQKKNNMISFECLLKHFDKDPS